MGIFGQCLIGWYVISILIWIIYGGIDGVTKGKYKEDIEKRKDFMKEMPWSLRIFTHIITFIYFYFILTITPLLPVLMLLKRKS